MSRIDRLIAYIFITAICGICLAHESNGAAVVSRTQRKSSAASRMPTMAMQVAAPSAPDVAVQPDTTDSATIIADDEPDDIIETPVIQNKASQFNEVLSANDGDTDSGSNTLAEQIRAQRAALDAADAAAAATHQTQAAMLSGYNACDKNLRACMMEKCGSDFTKCSNDSDTAFGIKLDACRLDIQCTGEEYQLFATAIKSDRNTNATVSEYNKIIDCGNRYNDCIITQCGQYFEKCLGKSAGDSAISKCSDIARSCTEMDSGLATRMMGVFGTLRTEAEEQVARDEERLYELRDMMRDTCNRIGAMFDERTLDCVYTVNFYAGNDNTLYASKKAYAGSTFDCTQNWFGIDITTFRENAMRLTREQTSASSAMLGSGVGMGVGALTSGAIDRAVDRHRAETALKDAQDEHSELYGEDTGTSDSKSDKSETKKEQQEPPQKDGKNVQDDNDKQSNASGDKSDTPGNDSPDSNASAGDSATGGSAGGTR